MGVLIGTIFLQVFFRGGRLLTCSDWQHPRFYSCPTIDPLRSRVQPEHVCSLNGHQFFSMFTFSISDHLTEAS